MSAVLQQRNGKGGERKAEISKRLEICKEMGEKLIPAKGADRFVRPFDGYQHPKICKEMGQTVMYRIAEHYEVVVNGKRFAVHYDRAVAERIAKANGGTVRIIPAHAIGENL